MQALFFKFANDHVVKSNVDQIRIQLNHHQIFHAADVGECLELGKVDTRIEIDGDFRRGGKRETREKSEHCEKETNRSMIAARDRVLVRHETPWARGGLLCSAGFG